MGYRIMRKNLLINVFLLALVLKLNAQNHSLSFSFAPQLSSIHIPKPYDSFKPAISHNFNLGYSLKSNKHEINASMQQHSINSGISYKVTEQGKPNGGIGGINSLFKIKGVTLSLGYGYLLKSNEKFEFIPSFHYSFGYYYHSGLRNFPPNLDITPENIALHNELSMTSPLEKLHHRIELATKLIFKSEKKVQFFLQPYYSLAVRLKDGKKQYAFTPVYWAFGIGFGVTYNFKNKK
jgi:hypothetical protein